MKISEYNKNIYLNYVFLFVSILLNVINIRFVLSYLGADLYGLWITVSSIVSWMETGDFGIGNGLRNELAKAFSSKNIDRERVLIGTGFKTIMKISGLMYIGILCVVEILLKYRILQPLLRFPLYVSSFFFCINLILGLSQSVAYGYQKSWFVSFSSCWIAVVSILTVICLDHSNVVASLTLFSAVQGFCVTFRNVMLIWMLHKKNIRIIECIRCEKEDTKVKKDIMSIGIGFFLLQFCGVILGSTDNVLINYLFDSTQVTKYSIITKIYDTGTSLFAIVLISLWSAVTFYYERNDMKWIQDKIGEIVKFWCIFACAVMAVSILFNRIVGIWLGNAAMTFDRYIIIIFAMYCLSYSFSAIFANVLNGMGKIRIQLFVTLIEAMINIPLSIYFARNCQMGITGIKLATFLCNIVNCVVFPIQTYILIKKNRKWSVPIERRDEDGKFD